MRAGTRQTPGAVFLTGVGVPDNLAFSKKHASKFFNLVGDYAKSDAKKMGNSDKKRKIEYL